MVDEQTPRLTCQDVIRLLADYLEWTLRPEAIAAFDAHLRACPSCLAYLRTYTKTRELTGRIHQVEMPGEMRDRLLSLLREHLRGEV